MVELLFASFEFAVTVLFGAILYLWCAVYFAVCVYLNEVRGLFARAAVTWRLRAQFKPARRGAEHAGTDRNRSSERLEPQCGPVGRGRFESWLN